jgi:hypothetical protein
MQTFKFDLRFQATVVVPEKFLQECLEVCAAPDATVFLKKLHDEFQAAVKDLTHEDTAAYSAACDALVGGILTNALRKGTQANTALLLAQAGLGSRVSPLEVLSIETVQPREDSRVRSVPSLGNDKAQPLSQGAAVQALQDARAE